MQSASKQVFLIANPISGKSRTHRHHGEIARALRSAGYGVRELLTEAPGHAIRLARSVDDDARAVLVFGGDGTVREVAEGLMNRQIPMYHVPAGNENLFARQFGMKIKPVDILAALERRNVTMIDLLDVSGQVCVACLGIALDGEVIRRVAAKRHGHVSHLDYAWPIATCFAGYRFPELEVIADGQSIFAGQGMFYAGNLAQYAVHLPLFKTAICDDGLLDIVVFPCRGRGQLFKALFSVILGRHINSRTAIYRRVREVTIRASADTACQLDGDVGPCPPIVARMMPKALAVLRP